MIIRDLTIAATGGWTTHAAVVAWEDNEFAPQRLTFEIDRDGADRGEPSADAFLAACYPLAAVHGESRVRIDGGPCPMLIEGLRTAHAWWVSWGGMPPAAPAIEARRRTGRDAMAGPRRAVGCLSGGVDGLHMLMRNRRLYRPDDPAYIREALFIHGFDIGKRARDPENERYEMALHRLAPIAAETGLRLISCRTNLRHLPTLPDFWTYRHNGAALAAAAHAAIRGAAYLFIGASFDAANPVPMGSHPTVDGLFSSQRLTILHDGVRFSRLDKVRDLVDWPTGLAALRVCSANIGLEANCGRCEKCLRTRLELLAAGADETAAFGASLTPIELWEQSEAVLTTDHAILYADLLPPLRARGLGALCRLLEKKMAAFRDGEGPAFARSGRAALRLIA